MHIPMIPTIQKIKIPPSYVASIKATVIMTSLLPRESFDHLDIGMLLSIVREQFQTPFTTPSHRSERSVMTEHERIMN